MTYLMLVRVPAGATPTEDESDPDTWVDEMTVTAQRLAGERLRPAQDATTVRAWAGEALVTHGPYVEIAEEIAGFDLLDATTLEQAIAVAARHPVARFGALELRELDPDHLAGSGDALRDGPFTYVLLITTHPDAPEPRPDAGPPTGWVDALRARAADRGGCELRPAAEAATVRVRGGELLVTRGPFADLAEQVAGYHLLDLPDLDAALDVAAAHPAVRHGVVEVRPTWPF